MNEIEFIVRQIDAEQRRLEEMLTACSAALREASTKASLGSGMRLQAAGGRDAPDEPYLACADYFVHTARRAVARDRAHCEALAAIVPPDDRDGQELLDKLRRSVQSGQEALAALEHALNERRAGRLSPDDFLARCARCVQGLEAMCRERPAGLYERLQRHYTVADWRRTSLVDADSILAERELHARALARLPSHLRPAGGAR